MFEFWQPRLRGTPILVSPHFAKLYFLFIFAYPENFMRLVWLKSLNFAAPVKGDTHFGILNFCQMLSFLYIYLPSCVQLKRLKSLNFGLPRLGVPTIFKTPNFC